MSKYKLSFIGLALASAVLFISLAFKVDIFESIIEHLSILERHEADEFIIPLAILALFALLDQNRRQRLDHVEIEKIKIYKAMLSSTHHILNNFLNQMLLFKMAAEDTPGFDPEVLALYDEIIKGASLQIAALGSIGQIDETTIFASVAPK